MDDSAIKDNTLISLQSDQINKQLISNNKENLKPSLSKNEQNNINIDLSILSYDNIQKNEIRTKKQGWVQQQYLNFLEKNKWDVERLKHWDVWDDLNDKEKAELYNICRYEPLFREVQEQVKQNPDVSIQLITNNEKYKDLEKYKKFKSWLKNKKYYQKNKRNNRQDTQISDLESTITSSLQYNQVKDIQNQIFILKEPLPTLAFNENHIFQQNLNSNIRQEWNILIEKCNQVSYQERCQLLQAYYFHDPQIFIDLLKEYSQGKYFKNIFSNLLSIIMQLSPSHEQTNLFIASFLFYNHEILTHSQKEQLLQLTIRNCILKLQREDDSTQDFGFIKFLFTNNFDMNDDILNELTIIIQEKQVAWKIFVDYLQGSPFFLRKEIIERVPKCGFFFKLSQVQLLKETKGDVYIRLPLAYRVPLIDITVFSIEKSKDVIKDLLIELSEYTQGYQGVLDKAYYIEFLKEVSKIVQNKSLLLFQNLQEVAELLYKIAQGIIEGRIINSLTLLPCLKGDMTCLDNEMKKTKVIKSCGVEEILSILQDFKQQNNLLMDVQQFEIHEFKQQTQQIFNKIEDQFGRPFHTLQILCIKFILSNIYRGSYFCNFGLGNGKTLLSIAIAIILNKITQASVVVLVKSPYLVYRDYKQFKKIIQNLDVKSSQYAIIKNGITFMDEKMFYKHYGKTQKNTIEKFKDVFLIIDEFDSIFDDGKHHTIFERIQSLTNFKRLIGFSGSHISDEEQQCLKEGLNAQFIVFPCMQDIYGNNILQRRSLVYNNDSLWYDSLLNICIDTRKSSPVIIALDNQDIKKVVTYFKKNELQINDLYELYKKSQFAELQTLIEHQFNKYTSDKEYGIYIINQDLGRGTDFPTSKEIENNGGLHLIIADVFEDRIFQQIKGRIGRMQNKGQFQYIVAMKQEGNMVDYIKMRQNIINLKSSSNSEKVLSLIRTNLTRSEIQNEQDVKMFDRDIYRKSNFYQEEDYEQGNPQVDYNIVENYDQLQALTPNDRNESDEEFKYSSNKKFLKFNQLNIDLRSHIKNKSNQFKRKSSITLENLEKEILKIPKRDEEPKQNQEEEKLQEENKINIEQITQ